MQFHKKNQENNINNEKIKMINTIQSDEINNVCFECGTNDPEYISINNGVFICKECVQDHFDFPHEISQIIINDLSNLNNNELKKLYLGGNKKLIEFINFDFPRLKQFPPNILYQTRAVDYYRKRLQFFTQGGIRPLKPIFEYAYQMINIPKNPQNYRKDIYLSPKVNPPNERISTTTKLTPISEGNQIDDENNCSTYSDNKDNNEIQTKVLTIDNLNSKDENNNFIYSPKKPKYMNNNSAFISINTSNINKSFESKSKDNEININPLIMPYKKHIIHNFKNENSKVNNKTDEMNMNINSDNNKNISEIITLNNNEKSINDDNFMDDNTIKSINKFMNNSKESNSSLNKMNKQKDNDKIIQINKEKNYDIIVKNENNEKGKNKNEKEQNNKIIKTLEFEDNPKNNNEKDFINNKNGKERIKKDIEFNNKNNDYKNQNKMFEDDSEKEMKKINVIIPRDSDEFSENGKNKKRKYLKANVSAKKLVNEDEDIDYNDNDKYKDFSPKKENKLVSLKNTFSSNDSNKIVPLKKNEFHNVNKKDIFYSSMSSNFINPLKYLKRSFQKKQEEKFGYNSDESESSNSKSYEEENKNGIVNNINKNNILNILDQPKIPKINKEIKIDEDIKNNNNILEKNDKKINQIIRNSLEKEGDTKESTESQQEEKNISIRQKYKNRRRKY